MSYAHVLKVFTTTLAAVLFGFIIVSAGVSPVYPALILGTIIFTVIKTPTDRKAGPS